MPPSTSAAPTTAPGPTTTWPFTGRSQVGNCTGATPIFDDADGDGYGYCLPGVAPTIPPTTLSPAAFDQIAEILDAPITAWARQPSGATFDAMTAAAAQVRAFAIPDAIGAALVDLERYPGNDQDVVRAIRDLTAAGVPGLPGAIGSGTYTVGVNVVPGRYRTVVGVNGCYWETLDSAGEINDNNFISSAPQVMFTVRASDYALNVEDCGMLIQID